ncbi:hypothetical protein GBA65_14855 [Rubrobacter marinus]|uniref:Uncharacterized protein n=1 Tax=Rubrobacter marinus TaxID=2653852 RepID=A0A6G8PZF2_9ACTN|nr:hypothetical protein GBA65_14855 [Rubrobacter marinus]
MDFAQLIEKIRAHLAEGGELVLRRPTDFLVACRTRGRAYAIFGYPSERAAGNDDENELFSQPAVGLGQLLWRMEELADDAEGGLAAWEVG